MYQGVKDLIAYQKARELAKVIFEVSKAFPKEEKYALTDQIRRSSRSIGANIAESWPKRKYIKSFVSKLVDAQSEGCETIHWIDIAHECNYIEKSDYIELSSLAMEVQRILEGIIKSPNKFCQ